MVDCEAGLTASLLNSSVFNHPSLNFNHRPQIENTRRPRAQIGSFIYIDRDKFILPEQNPWYLIHLSKITVDKY